MLNEGAVNMEMSIPEYPCPRMKSASIQTPESSIWWFSFLGSQGAVSKNRVRSTKPQVLTNCVLWTV